MRFAARPTFVHPPNLPSRDNRQPLYDEESTIPQFEPPKPIVGSRVAAERYQAEIRFLSLLVEKHRRSTDHNGVKACEFVNSKLADASRAITSGDEEGAWFHVYGAASLCTSFEIEAQRVSQVLVRLNNLMK